MELTADQQRIAEGVRAILVQKGPDGEYVYTKEEVRDFIAACVLELGLPIVPEVRGAMLQFLAEVDFGADASNEDMAAAIKSYFDAHPLNPSLRAELERFTRSEAIEGQGYRDNDQQLDALRALGKDVKMSAPRAETQPKVEKPRVKRGLS